MVVQDTTVPVLSYTDVLGNQRGSHGHREERGQLYAGHTSAVTDRALTLTEERCCLHYGCYEYPYRFSPMPA